MVRFLGFPQRRAATATLWRNDRLIGGVTDDFPVR